MNGIRIIAAFVAMAVLLPAAALCAEKSADLEMLYQQALHKEEAGDAVGAAVLYRDIVSRYDADRAVAGMAYLHLAKTFERQDKKPDAVTVYRTLVTQFPDSKEAGTARERLAALGAGPAAGNQSETDIREKLRRRMPEVNLTGATLAQVVDYIRNAGGVNVVVNPVLGERGQDINEGKIKIDLVLKDVNLEDVLNLATKSFLLDGTVYSGAVYIADKTSIDIIRMEAAKAVKEAEVARRIAAMELRGAGGVAGLGTIGGMGPGAPIEGMSVTLYRQGSPGPGGPTVLDLDSGKADWVPPATDVRDYLKEHPEFDLAYLPEYGLVVNSDSGVGVVPSEGDMGALPQILKAPDMKDAEVLFARIKSQGQPAEPGIYKDKSGLKYLWQVNGLCLVRTRSMIFCVSPSGSTPDAITVMYSRLPMLRPVTISHGAAVDGSVATRVDEALKRAGVRSESTSAK